MRQQRAADLGHGVRSAPTCGRTPSAHHNSWKEPVAEVLKALGEAPDAVRDRLACLRKAKALAASKPPTQLGRCRATSVVSSWLYRISKSAAALWKAREIVASYLARQPGVRSELLAELMASIGSPPSAPPICRAGSKCFTDHPAHAPAQA